MFGFGKTNTRSAGRRQVGRTLARVVPYQRPAGVHGEVLAELGRIADTDARRSPQRLEAVFFLDGQCAGLRKSLTVQYIEHATRSSKIEHQLWSALFDLTQAFLGAYYAFAREVSHHAQSAKWQQLLPELLVPPDRPPGTRRQDQAVPLRAMDSRQMDRAARAVHAGLLAPVRAPAAGARPRAAPPRRSSTSTCWSLLMQLMNAGNMTARHLEWVSSELNEWCAQLRLSLEPSSVTSFYVDLGSREGLRRRTPAPLEGRVLFLDTRPLHSVLMQNVLMLEQKIKGQPLSDRTLKRSEQLALAHQARVAGRSGIQAVGAPRRADGRRGHRRCDRRLRQDLGLPARGRPDADTVRGDRQELRRHDGARGVRPHAQRARPAGRARAAPLCAVRGARRALGSQGREPDRFSPARADERRQRGHARHARRDPAARPDAVDARHRAPDEEDDRRPRGDRPAGHRQHAGRRRSRRTAQEPRCRLFGGRRNDDDQRPHLPGPLSRAARSAKAIRPSNR